MKPGYKQTEVGLIPDEWSLKGLGDVSDIDVGLSKPKIVFGSGCPVVTVQDLYAGSIINSSALKRVVVTEDEINNYRLEKDDILISNASVKRDGIGYSNRFDGSNEDVIFAKYAYRARNLRAILPLFLHHALRAPFCRLWIISNSQTGTLTNLNKAAARSIPIPVPPIPEQRAIAEALSDVDGLLGGLDRLIAKKRDLKQAAMQQLLTGQTRLPGFHGEWEVKRLDALADIRSGGTPSTSDPRFWDGEIPWCTPTDITDLNGHKYLGETARMITPLGLNASSAEMIPAHSVVMTSRATIGECAINTVPVSTNQGFKNFIPFETTDVDFLYYLLITQKQGFISLCGGSTFLEIGKTQLVAYQVRLPATKAEQTAIATVLSDMDAELAALEQRREKTRALKQGMMQELLTGRIRLVPGIERNIGDEGDVSPSISVSPASSLSPLHPAPPPAKLRHGK